MPDSKSYDLDHTATEKNKNKYHHGNIYICIFFILGLNPFGRNILILT